MPESAPFPWPPLADGQPPPAWDGSAFAVGGERLPVLRYSGDESGWDAGLTEFHEDNASGDHPMDQASRRAAVRALTGRLAPGAVILEVGCSSGFLLPLLRRAFPGSCVIGSDAFPQALESLAARQPGYPLIQFDLTRCPLPDGCVDAVVLLNVLEHIDDDVAALEQAWRVLRPGGLAYVEVPAGPSLYDAYDELLRHRRRYSAAALRRKAHDARFAIDRLSHLGCLVFPAFVVAKKRNQRQSAKDPEAKKALVARSIAASRASLLLRWAFALEDVFGRFLRLPFGIRCVAVLRKPR